jgi:hypothetical protein
MLFLSLIDVMITAFHILIVDLVLVDCPPGKENVGSHYWHKQGNVGHGRECIVTGGGVLYGKRALQIVARGVEAGIIEAQHKKQRQNSQKSSRA